MKYRKYLKTRDILEHRLLFFSLIFKWTASPLQFIFVVLAAARSGKVKTWKIGYTQDILSPDTLHLPPNTKETLTTGTRPPPEIQEASSSGAAGLHTHSLCTSVPEEQNRLTFECFSSLENHSYCERSVHLSMSAQQVSSPHRLIRKSRLFRGRKKNSLKGLRLLLEGLQRAPGPDSPRHPEPPAPRGRSRKRR